MPQDLATRRVFLLGNPEKHAVSSALRELSDFAASRCELVGAQAGLDVRPALAAGAETLIVLGGDGSILVPPLDRAWSSRSQGNDTKFPQHEGFADTGLLSWQNA